MPVIFKNIFYWFKRDILCLKWNYIVNFHVFHVIASPNREKKCSQAKFAFLWIHDSYLFIQSALTYNLMTYSWVFIGLGICFQSNFEVRELILWTSMAPWSTYCSPRMLLFFRFVCKRCFLHWISFNFKVIIIFKLLIKLVWTQFVLPKPCKKCWFSYEKVKLISKTVKNVKQGTEFRNTYFYLYCVAN